MTTLGSRCALELPEFAAGWRNLQGWCDDMRLRVSTSAHPSQAAKAFTRLAHLRALAIVTCFAGRGTRLERLTWYTLYGVAPLIFVVDKRSDSYSDIRAVPVHDLLREQLDAWLADLDILIATCSRFGVDVGKDGRRIDSRKPSRAALFGVKLLRVRGALEIHRSRLVGRRLDTWARHCFAGRRRNVGRHTLISHGVRLEWDPWALKMLTGHHRGEAEPFADGGMVSPRCGLGGLRGLLDHLLSPLLRTAVPTQTRWVLPIEMLPSRLPACSGPDRQIGGTRSRVLPPPWHALTPSALRVVDHLRRRVAGFDGPSNAGAQLLLSMLLMDFVPLSDIEAILSATQPMKKLGSIGVAVWQRSRHAQDIHRPLDAHTLIALGRAMSADGMLPSWAQCRDQTAAWLRYTLPELCWPDSTIACLRAIDVFALMWCRHALPPFLLAAASPRLPAAAATRSSLIRLYKPAREIDAAEVLIAPPPRVRGPNRPRVKKSPLSAVLERVHHWGSIDKLLGEDKARWSGLWKDVSSIDVESDTRARALACLIEYEKQHFDSVDDRDQSRSYGRPIEVASLSTYLYSIGPDFDLISPTDDLNSWFEEWIDWTESIWRKSVQTKKRTIEQVRKSRADAVRHLLRSLRAVGYRIPDEALALGKGESIGPCGRRAAAATVLLANDQTQIERLIDRHHLDTELGRMRAGLYVRLSLEASMRSCEIAAMEIDALSEFDDLAVHSVGFSHLKSPNSWRLQPVDYECAQTFRSTTQLLREASPEARWVFLDADEDRAWANQTAHAYSVAIRQVTGEADARPHASRAVAPLEKILPGWEDVARELVRGGAGVERCAEFVESIESRGVAHLVHQLVYTGHGHPVTYLTYYFAVWPWLLAIYARALNAELARADDVARRLLGEARAAYRKAKQRFGVGFDGWAWMRQRAVAAMCAPDLEASPILPNDPATPREGLATSKGGTKTASADGRVLRYLASRFMGLSEIAAAHLYELDSRRAAALEARFDARFGSVLRSRDHDDDRGRGRQAELRLLRGELGSTIAARLEASCRSDLSALAEWLVAERRAPRPILPIDALMIDLQRCAAVLPSSLGLWVQSGIHRYTSDDLTRFARLGSRIVAGPPDRDVGNRPRVRVVDASQPNNRVSRARLTSLVRCLVEAALIVHDTVATP